MGWSMLRERSHQGSGISEKMKELKMMVEDLCEEVCEMEHEDRSSAYGERTRQERGYGDAIGYGVNTNPSYGERRAWRVEEDDRYGERRGR